MSVVSAWEIAIKAQNGKLSFDVPIEEVLSGILSGTEWPVVPVLPRHIPEPLQLPLIHHEGMVLVTSDANILKYKVTTLR